MTIAAAVSEPRTAARAQRLESFGRSLDALRREVESSLGMPDVEHVQRIQRLSKRLEILGRTLIHLSFEPAGFSLGVAALWGHKSLELMELGHMVLHGCYDKLPGAEAFRADTFRWKSPIDERAWHRAHNIRHHQYTNIEGRDPDIDFAGMRLSPHVPFRELHRLQPLTNVLSWLGFAVGINLHATGMLDIYLQKGELTMLSDRSPDSVRAAKRAFWDKTLRYFAREYVFFPMLAGPFFWKVLLGNVLSEVGRDLFSGAIIYCGHVGVRDFPEGAHAKGRAEWYVMQAEAARDIEVPHVVSVLCGGLDRQVEHHLFPRLPANRLREITPRVKAICEEHGVAYNSARWPKALRDVFARLRLLSSPHATT